MQYTTWTVYDTCVFLPYTCRIPAVYDRIKMCKGNYWIGSFTALIYNYFILQSDNEWPIQVSFNQFSWYKIASLSGNSIKFKKKFFLMYTYNYISKDKWHLCSISYTNFQKFRIPYCRNISVQFQLFFVRIFWEENFSQNVNLDWKIYFIYFM